jgi:hypothetical protein
VYCVLMHVVPSAVERWLGLAGRVHPTLRAFDPSHVVVAYRCVEWREW